jgi:hypothetical protein
MNSPSAAPSRTSSSRPTTPRNPPPRDQSENAIVGTRRPSLRVRMSNPCVCPPPSGRPPRSSGGWSHQGRAGRQKATRFPQVRPPLRRFPGTSLRADGTDVIEYGQDEDRVQPDAARHHRPATGTTNGTTKKSGGGGSVPNEHCCWLYPAKPTVGYNQVCEEWGRQREGQRKTPQVLVLVAFASKPPQGFEPWTPALRKLCSTAELRRRLYHF